MDYWDTNVLSGIIGFAGSVLGGIFTMWGVNKTLKKQNEEKFRETFVLKIRNLDAIIEKLNKFDEAKEDKYKRYFDNFYDFNKKENVENHDSIFLDLIKLSVEVDGKVYKEIKHLEEFYLTKFKSAKENSEIILLGHEDIGRPVVDLTEKAKRMIKSIEEGFHKNIRGTLSTIKIHKEKLEREYFND